ncbi:hypothetical protein CRYUN_Cryun22dG0050200 [Craigia yunnanensis]
MAVITLKCPKIEMDVIDISVARINAWNGDGLPIYELGFDKKSVARLSVVVSKSSKIVVEKSTIPIKTTEAIEKIINHNSKDIDFQILSNLEFLVEGIAIQDLYNHDRVLIGGRETSKCLKTIGALNNVYVHWVSID